MCFTGWCPHERYSYSQEDCICKKPAGWPCPEDVDDEEAERLNDEYDDPEEERAYWEARQYEDK